jgi:predicted nucleic acid-binding protein
MVDPGAAGSWARAKIAEAGSIAAPHVWSAEVASALRGQERRGVLSADDARHWLDRALELPVSLYGFEALAPDVWNLRQNLTAYDAWYVALAAKLKAPFVTLDGRAARAPSLPCEVLTPP